MYLQSLEMVGFKSFAPKTTLQFHPGVTAIVGPNGCGKSNVLDALRWVLGEQSAKALRGGEMADVIFSGTDSRQALGMAEVSLTFSECEKELGVEWNEVRLTRRVYRDGKSEYFLNKAPCRLRDIHQLFMDTGIGRSAYSIMEQGKIDAILSSRPEDRRAIFEEAAGITRYKAQKKEALRKLEYTEANLVRVADIMKEVKRQIGSLQRQAAKARRYQSLMEDLTTFDTHLSYRTFTSLTSDLDSVRKELAGTGEARAARELRIAGHEESLSLMRDELATLDTRIHGVRENIQEHRNRIHAAGNRITTNRERADEARSMIDRSRLEIAAGEEKLREQETQIARTDEMLNEMLGVLRSGEDQLTSAGERLRSLREERVGAERELADLGSTVQAVEMRLQNLRGEVSRASGRREAAAARLQILRAERDSARSAADEAASRVDSMQADESSAESALAAATSDLDEAQSLLDEAQRERQTRESEWNAASRELSSRESRLEVLRQMEAEGEGLGEGTQAVLRGLSDPDLIRPAVMGALASLIEVEGKYIPAIEAALGSNLQAIVFKDAMVAESAARMLAESSSGRASLIPREWFAADKPASDGSAPQGSLGWAKDFAHSRQSDLDLAAALLDGFVLVESLDTAFFLKSGNPSLGFVTLAGDVISRHGVVSAGRTGDNGSSVLVRRNQISALESEVSSTRSAVDGAERRREASVAILESAQERVAAARETAQTAQLDLSTIRSELAQAERQAADAIARSTSFEREAETLATTAGEAADSVVALEAEIESIDESLRRSREKQTDVRSNIETARERERTANDELNELRVRVATERQQQENLSRQRGPMAARVSELADLLNRRGSEISEFERRIADFETESAQLADNIEKWRMILETGEGEVAALVNQRSEVVGSVEEIEGKLRSERHDLSEMQEARSRLEVRASQLEMRIEHVVARVQQRYHLALAEFRPDRYGLLAALREREKRQRSQGTGGSDGTSDTDVVGSSSAEQSTNVEAGGQPADHEAKELPAGNPDIGSSGSPPEEDEIPWDRIEQLVSELSGKVDSMGPVNLEAIQEYDELEERHQFLEQQNTDLINSKAELLEVISKINRTTRELFAETFEKVRENFRTMFTELFGGGKANLVLADESDPLECGIEIIAKPPGKQLQSISLLSGGEKTMTAVSLLFAIYMVKPSPFCVLDEMDAPLDESNISRFIKILDRFVGQSQFVVITHNKRTIARADTVFGVTMEEHGISKVVSVKFHSRDTQAASNGANGHSDPHPAPRSVAETFGKHGNLQSEKRPLTEEPVLVT